MGNTRPSQVQAHGPPAWDKSCRAIQMSSTTTLEDGEHGQAPAAASRLPAFFRAYTDYPRTAPAWMWEAARVITLVNTLGLIALLWFKGEAGLKVFWGIAIPAVPFLLVVAPGLWRQVCPMAFLNQLPRALGFSLNRELPERWKTAAFPIAVGLFVGLVALRVPLLNHSPQVLALGLLGVLGLAFAGGRVFKGRSGWCGTFCPLGPIQRTYGQAPLAVVPNGYCPTCVGCQKNCYDLNPRGAVFQDLYDEDPRHAWQRRLFMGLLPGLIAGFFLQGPAPAQGLPTYWAILLASACASAGLYGVLHFFLPLNAYRLASVFGAAALALFYWFSGPVILRHVGELLGWQPHDAALNLARAVGMMAAVLLLLSSVRSHRADQLLRRETSERKARTATARRVIPIQADTGPRVTDRTSGTVLDVVPGQTLLEAIREAELPIQHSCHAGMCGADAVAVCDGGAHLSPPSDTELATLRRLGLEGKARLACMCEVQGPVTIDRNPHADLGEATPTVVARGAAAPAMHAQPDPAAALGIERVVVVGNGVAGMSAIDALRRASPSVELTVVGDEPGRFYNRMAIAQLISGEADAESLALVPPRWQAEKAVRAVTRTRVTAIDRAARLLTLSDGERLRYDRLILATGASAAAPGPDFLNHPNAFVLRTMEDAHAIRAQAEQAGAGHAIVMGGGVLGVEAALALRARGLGVTLLERAERLMAAQLDEVGAQRLAAFLDGIGIRSLTGVSVQAFEGEPDKALRSLVLGDGQRLPVDLIVACLGIRPHSELAVAAGLEVGPRGICVDAAMRTSDPAILAVGDVAQPNGPGGLWQVGASQAEVAVNAMLGGEALYTPPEVVLQLKCKGLDVSAFGLPQGEADDEVWTAPPDAATWWRVRWQGSVLKAGLVVGAPGRSRAFAKALKAGDAARIKVALQAL